MRRCPRTRCGPSVDSAEQALLQCDHQSIGPPPALDKLFEPGPAMAGLLDLRKPGARLVEMGGDAEARPGRRVTVGLVAAPLDALQHRVVVGRVLRMVRVALASGGWAQSPVLPATADALPTRVHLPTNSTKSVGNT